MATWPDLLDAVVPMGLTPLVGREQEVELLLERWAQVKDGLGQVVLLSGEAGIGKSRLVQVLKERVADEPHTRLECRCSPYHQHSALYPIIDLWQRVLRLQRHDTPDIKVYGWFTEGFDTVDLQEAKALLDVLS